MNNRRNLAFDRTNFILLGIGFAVVVIGLFLMGGSSSTETVFNPDVFSFRRIKLAPVVCFTGFIFMIFAIVHKPKDTDNSEEETKDELLNNNQPS
ncbi:MAG: DUF3098 domain-containing protein [Prevotella sp.]|jgi:uncharacterized membrane protein YidH (DUF202 family)